MDKDKALELAMKHFGLLAPSSVLTEMPVAELLDALSQPSQRIPMQKRIQQSLQERSNDDGA
jgi:hypothetical protein